MWELHWPWLGIAIPCALIAGIGYPAHFLVFRYHQLAQAQITYQACVTILWISYYLAIVTSPGAPPRKYLPPAKHWKRWCTRCSNYKPERAHHCRKCRVCTLAMDHHCPWTNNCVGHGNTPHFFRFLVWVLVATGTTFVWLWQSAVIFWTGRHEPAYLFRKSELAAVIVLLPLDGLVFLAVALLCGKCLVHVIQGRTQIEVWDLDRLDSQFHTERLWLKIRNNYKLVHQSELPELVSWSSARPRKSASPIVPDNFTIDDVVFPYDNGWWLNLTNALGPVWLWVLPWGRARGDGITFPRNTDDDQLNLPWPPDGGNVDFEGRRLTDVELRELDDVTLIKKHLDPRSTAKRSDWVNDQGETLGDYGVDTAADEDRGLMQ